MEEEKPKWRGRNKYRHGVEGRGKRCNQIGKRGNEKWRKVIVKLQ